MPTTFSTLPEVGIQADPKPMVWTAEEYHRLHDLDFFLDQRVELIGGEIIGSDLTKPRRWTADELYRLLDLGFFLNQRVELIGGEILVMASQKNFHYAAIVLTADALRAAFGPGFWVREQASLDLSPLSVPDPDIAVVPGSARHAAAQNPTSALLTTEVSETTLAYDRGTKASLYAAADIPDYWIVNLVHRQLEVHRNPVADTSQPFGWRYADVTILGLADFVSPLAAHHARIAVADVLP